MYDNFSKVYDLLNTDADYEKRTEYIFALFEKFDRVPALMLDLACGTGEFSNRFAAKGVSVIGVDISPEMLSVAADKSRSAGLEVLYLCQPAQELDLYGTVDGAICCLDSLNHITDYGDFCKAIKQVSLFLETDRLFIFDLNTEYKHKSVLADNTFIKETEDVYCVWQNSFDKKNSTTSITLDFFKRESDGTYERFEESFCERAYSEREIASALKSAGLEILTVYEELSEKKCDGKTQRAVYITKKKKNK